MTSESSTFPRSSQQSQDLLRVDGSMRGASITGRDEDDDDDGFDASQTQTQSDFCTQNEMTQLVEEDSNSILSPMPPQSPVNLRTLPWGRLIPCSRHWSTIHKTQEQAEQTGQRDFAGGIDLLPKPPPNKDTPESSIHREENPITASILGLENLRPSDTFNEYTLGRNAQCDVVSKKPRAGELAVGKNITAEMRGWAHSMISNHHCRIFCMLKPGASRNTAATSTNNASTYSPNDMEVYIEDTSGNGTFINHTTILRRGEKRILHTGDEISLVNAATLRKKIHSKDALNELQRHHSFIFVNLYQQRTLMPPPPQSARRRGLVDVRAMQSHSILAGTSRRSSPALSVSSSSSHRRISPRRREPRRIEEDYDIRDLLGSGTCGEVRRAIHRRTGQEWAVKIISLSGRNSRRNATDTVATLEAEASILQALDHPYIVQLTDVFVSPGVAIYLVMELLHGGDLFDRIVEKGKYTEVQSRRVMRRLLSAVYYLHETKNIVHRDLKPENILCVSRQDDIHVKLTDFGLAKSVTDEGLKTFCGTPQYFAPEVLRRRHTVAGRGRYGKQADMWSLGIICYILLSGAPPFDVTHGMDVVADANIKFPEERWGSVSDEAKDIVTKFLTADPKKRISVMDACNHGWVLTEDGDTHSHPLDDPVVDPKALSKRLLLYESQDESVASDNDVEEPESTGEEGATTSNVAPSLVNTNASTVSHEGPVETEDGLGTDHAPPVGPAVCAKESPDGSVALKNTPDNTRLSLVPVSMNARSNHFRELVTGSVEKSTSAERAQAAPVPGAQQLHSSRILITPRSSEGASHIASATFKSADTKITLGSKRKLKKQVALNGGTVEPAELTDDEICSHFSEDGDSISSLGTHAEEGKKTASLQTEEKEKEKPQVQPNKLTSYLTRLSKNKAQPHDSKDATPRQTRKRPRTCLDDNEDDSEGPASSPMSPMVKSPNKTESPKSIASSVKAHELGKHFGGKQTKLSNWFLKKDT